MSAVLLFALIGFRFFTALVLLAGLIITGMIPKNSANFATGVSQTWKSARIGAIVFFSIALGLTLLSIVMLVLNFFVLQTSRLISLIINVFDILMALGLLGVSIPLIVAEKAIDKQLFSNAVTRYLFVTAGIMGIIAVTMYILDLFVSRFYQFSVYEDSWYDDLWEYIYKYFYPIPPVYHVELDDKI